MSIRKSVAEHIQNLTYEEKVEIYNFSSIVMKDIIFANGDLEVTTNIVLSAVSTIYIVGREDGLTGRRPRNNRKDCV
jgi:hypothetical protein